MINSAKPINRKHDRHSGRSVFGPIRNPEVTYIEIPGSRFARPGMTASKRETAMNFDFSDEQKQLRDEARKFLAEKCPPKAVRVVLDGKEPYDRELWKGLADMGFLGVAIPAQFGGAGAGALELC